MQCFQPAAVVDLDAMAVAAAPAVKIVNATLIPAATAVTRLCSKKLKTVGKSKKFPQPMGNWLRGN